MLFLLKGDARLRKLSSLAPFCDLPLYAEREKTSKFCTPFAFADGWNRTRAACAARECAIHYTSASRTGLCDLFFPDNTLMLNHLERAISKVVPTPK